MDEREASDDFDEGQNQRDRANGRDLNIVFQESNELAQLKKSPRNLAGKRSSRSNRKKDSSVDTEGQAAMLAHLQQLMASQQAVGLNKM